MNKSRLIYQKREDLIYFSQSCKLESDILSSIEKKNYSLIIDEYFPKAKQQYETVINNNIYGAELPVFLRRYTAGYTYIRCLSHCVDVLEKQKKHSEANKLIEDILLSQNSYCQDYRGVWFERLALNYEHHLKQKEQALIAVENGLKDSNVRFGRRLALYIRRKNLQKSLKRKIEIIEEFENLGCSEITITAYISKYTVAGRNNIFVLEDQEKGDVAFVSVEIAAIEHYRKNGYPNGIHSESLVYHAIFGLLFWDIIYFNDNQLVVDSFRFFYQRLPLDFNTDDFYLRRKEFISEKLKEINEFSEEQLKDCLENSWNSNKNKFSLVNWDSLTLDKIQVNIFIDLL